MKRSDQGQSEVICADGKTNRKKGDMMACIKEHKKERRGLDKGKKEGKMKGE